MDYKGPERRALPPHEEITRAAREAIRGEVLKLAGALSIGGVIAIGGSAAWFGAWMTSIEEAGSKRDLIISSNAQLASQALAANTAMDVERSRRNDQRLDDIKQSLERIEGVLREKADKL